MKKNGISVIVTVYNKEKTLKKTFDSVLCQKCDFPIYIIVVNDCSTDNSKSIIEGYQKKYNNIFYYENETNKGYYPSVLYGYKNIHTEYFCVLDSDDYWIDDEFLNKGISFLIKIMCIIFWAVYRLFL